MPAGPLEHIHSMDEYFQSRCRERPESSDPGSYQGLYALGVRLFFASCVQVDPHMHHTLKTSRVVAFGALGDTIGEVSELVDRAIANHFRGNLEYRRDIGAPKYVANLKTKLDDGGAMHENVGISN